MRSVNRSRKEVKPLHSLQIENQELIEVILSAHFVTERKIQSVDFLRKSAQSRKIVDLVFENYDEIQLKEMLMKCVKPEMMWHLVNSTIDQSCKKLARIELAVAHSN